MVVKLNATDLFPCYFNYFFSFSSSLSSFFFCLYTPVCVPTKKIFPASIKGTVWSKIPRNLKERPSKNYRITFAAAGIVSNSPTVKIFWMASEQHV